MEPHRFQLKVYLEDTDAQGIVYHANYLNYLERARTEILELNGKSPVEAEWRYVVHEVQLKFHQPGLLGDSLEVRTVGKRASAFRMTFEQKVFRAAEDKPLVSGEVHVVCIGPTGELTELPTDLLGA